MKKVIGSPNPQYYGVLHWMVAISAIIFGLLSLPEATVCAVLLIGLIAGAKTIHTAVTASPHPQVSSNSTPPHSSIKLHLLTYLYGLSKPNLDHKALFLGLLVDKLYGTKIDLTTLSGTDTTMVLDLAQYFSNTEALSERTAKELMFNKVPIPEKSPLPKVALSAFVSRIFFEQFRHESLPEPLTDIQLTGEILNDLHLTFALRFLVNMKVPIPRDAANFFRTLGDLLGRSVGLDAAAIEEIQRESESSCQFATIRLRNPSSIRLIHEITLLNPSPSILVIGPGYYRECPAFSPALSEIHAAAPRAKLTVVDPYFPPEFDPKIAPPNDQIEAAYNTPTLNDLFGPDLAKSFMREVRTAINDVVLIRSGIESVSPMKKNQFDAIVAQVSLVYANCMDIVKYQLVIPLIRLVWLLHTLKQGGIFICDEVELKSIFWGLAAASQKKAIGDHYLALIKTTLNTLLDVEHQVSSVEYLGTSPTEPTTKSYVIRLG